MENKEHSTDDKNENLFYIITDFFQKDGRSIRTAIEDYIINNVSSLIVQKG